MRNSIYEYSPIRERTQLRWPDKARVAFWVGVNIEHYELGKSGIAVQPGGLYPPPDPMNYGWRDYGVRVGIWRLMDLLDEYRIRASVLLNSDVCNYYPQIIEEGKKRRWAWLAHGKNNSILEINMSLEKERNYLAKVISVIRKSTGQQPKGWLGPGLTETYNTPSLLAELGITYVCDWCNDDQPYPINVRKGRMISVPYSLELNDVQVFAQRGMTGPEYLQLVKDQFDVLYQEGGRNGKVMALPLHPFLTSHPFRHKYLAKALEYITNHERVWLATSDEIAEWYYNHYYAKAV